MGKKKPVMSPGLAFAIREHVLNALVMLDEWQRENPGVTDDRVNTAKSGLMKAEWALAPLRKEDG